ncbi:hypothetical protein ACGFMO_32125 [Streptomyces niveus]|jgi:4-hydroxy-3-methylbut-2-enyl diphosphate reductase IspH|uniref:hypothetical protein n=1 Tax=Streptomyces niveus TaxID=193462 RepID=UPI00371E0DBA
MSGGKQALLAEHNHCVVREFARDGRTLLLVVRSTNSSNSIRMVEVARRAGGRAELGYADTSVERVATEGISPPARLTGVADVP